MTQNQRPYESIESFRTRINSEKIFLESAFEGCTLSEISQIESHLNFNLPDTIKEFLLFCGKKWKGIYVLHSLQKKLLDKFPYQKLEESKLESEEDQGISGIDLSELVIIDFKEHLGEYHWSFFYKKDKNDNPNIYSITYEELNNNSIPFTQYIGNKLESAIKFATQLFVSDYHRFEVAMTYINPLAVKKLNIQSHELSLKANELIKKLPNLKEVAFDSYNSNPDNSWEFDIPFNTSLKKIRISSVELRKLFLPIEGLPNLESLRISSENLTEIPKNLSSCQNLVNLRINGNFKEVPKEIFKLRKLEELQISNILFEVFPVEVASLVNLIKISLRGNLLKFPIGLYSLKNLSEIDLAENTISNIDEEVKNINTLKKLNISKNSISNSELERISKMLPNVQIFSWNQKPYIKPNANPSQEFQILVEDKNAEKYFAQLDKYNLYYIRGVVNSDRQFINTNKYDYQRCIEILNEIKTADNKA